MVESLNGKKILVLVSNGVDQDVMSMVQRDLLKSGAEMKTVGTEPGLVNSWNGKSWGIYFPVDTQVSKILGSDFDMLVIPSGERAIAKLTSNPHSERIISSFIDTKKPICLIGNAVKLLEVTGNKEAESWVMSGDCSEDINAFVEKMIAYFASSEEVIEDIKKAA